MSWRVLQWAGAAAAGAAVGVALFAPLAAGPAQPSRSLASAAGPGVSVGLITAPASEARPLARKLVESELVACVNILPGVTSVYKWKGAVEVDEEHMLVVKTPAHNRDAVTALVRRLHSYDTPEVLFLPVEGGSADYLAWVAEATRPAE